MNTKHKATHGTWPKYGKTTVWDHQWFALEKT